MPEKEVRKEGEEVKKERKTRGRTSLTVLYSRRWGTSHH
jgi:hypothetical protein